MVLRRILLLAVEVCLLAILVGPPLHFALLTVALIPHFFPGDVPRPLRAFTAQPVVTTVEVPGAPGHMVADIYRLPSAERQPAMILLLGVNPLPRTDEQVTTLAEGIARTGIVTVVAESEALLAGEIRPEEVDNLVALVQILRQDPGIDPRRIGMSGFCIGGVLELLAAGDARLADEIAYVNAFSVYADPVDVLRAVLTRTVPGPTGPEPWMPAELTQSVFTRQAIQALPNVRDRGILQRELVDHTPLTSPELETLTPLGRQVRTLLSTHDAAEVDQIVAELPASFTDALRRLSPAAAAPHIRAKVFLMHDRDDTYLPVTGARQLAQLLPEDSRQMYSEFRLFQHVVPGGISDPRQFAQEMLKLFRHIYAVLTAAHEVVAR